MAHSTRSFADDIRSRNDDQLRALLRARPDLVRPAPKNLTALAARTATRNSIQRALDSLHTDHLRVLEAIVVSGADAAPRLLGTTARALHPLLDDLRQHGLLWHSPEGLRVVRAVPEILTSPARLGPPARDLGVTDHSRNAAAAYKNLSGQAKSAIDQLCWTHPRASFDGPAAHAVRDELIVAGLVVATKDGAVIPRDIGVALRDGRLYRDGIAPPQPPSDALAAVDVDTAAAGEALEILWCVEEVERLWEHNPPRVLQSGGLSVRDHRLVASALNAEAKFAAFVIEISYAAGLFAQDEAFEPSWLPTRAYDDWVAAEPASQWATLATAWRDTTHTPSLAGTSSDSGVVNMLSNDINGPMMRQCRLDVLTILNELPEFTAVPTEYVDASLHWRRPLRLPEGVPTRATDVLREAAWLGVTGRGALSSPGRALAAGDNPGNVMLAALPVAIDYVLLQADLTAVAPGPLTKNLRRLMQLVANVESRGGATVYRFTESSVRRTLDSGLSTTELTEQIRTASRTPVPQPLEYLIGDVARRHGQTRVGTAGCYLRGDNTAALNSMVADHDLFPLQLRKIAPTIVISPTQPEIVLKMLRNHGYAPIAETVDGHVVHIGLEHRRAPNPQPQRPSMHLDQIDDDIVERLVTWLREAETSFSAIDSNCVEPNIPSTDLAVTLTVLQDAAVKGASVWIGYIDATGALCCTLFRPHRVGDGRIFGADGDETRSFSIHRISGVAPA